MDDEKYGLQIDWTIKNYSFYSAITLTGAAILVGWFKLTVLLMGLGLQ
jgi:hypothetical protein